MGGRGGGSLVSLPVEFRRIIMEIAVGTGLSHVPFALVFINCGYDELHHMHECNTVILTDTNTTQRTGVSIGNIVKTISLIVP